MLPILTKKQKQQLAGTDVLAIYLFGSRAQGMATAFSDYDYAILTKKKHGKGDKLYRQLYDLLSEISPRTAKNDVLDIVFLNETGLELRFHVIRYGVLLYDRDPSVRLDFETRTSLLYCDYRPLLDYFDNAILEAL